MEGAENNRMLAGFQHGDLNIGNILAKFAKDSEHLEAYFLLDFALVKPNAPPVRPVLSGDVISDPRIRSGILPEMGLSGHPLFKPRTCRTQRTYLRTGRGVCGYYRGQKVLRALGP